MTHKEQAIKEQALELIDSFIQASVVNEDGTTWHHPKPYTMAVQCALIAVEKILNNDGFTQFDQYLTEHWLEVKKELEGML